LWSRKTLTQLSIATSIASRDASLKTLDPLELARSTSNGAPLEWRSQGWRSHHEVARSVLYGVIQALHNRLQLLCEQNDHQKRSKTYSFFCLCKH
jgi:hypothetical protein